MIAINNMAAELGVDAKKIKYVNLAPSDAIAALQKGDIDAMACWEPFITKAIKAADISCSAVRRAISLTKKAM